MEEGCLLHVYYTVLGWSGEGAAGVVCKWTMKSVINVYTGATFIWNSVTVLETAEAGRIPGKAQLLDFPAQGGHCKKMCCLLHLPLSSLLRYLSSSHPLTHRTEQLGMLTVSPTVPSPGPGSCLLTNHEHFEGRGRAPPSTTSLEPSRYPTHPRFRK